MLSMLFNLLVQGSDAEQWLCIREILQRMTKIETLVTSHLDNQEKVVWFLLVPILLAVFGHTVKDIWKYLRNGRNGGKVPQTVRCYTKRKAVTKPKKIRKKK